MSFSEAIEIGGESFHYITNFQGKPFAIDRTLAANLLVKLKWIKHYQGDIVLFIDGGEGTGKSTFARQIAKLLDPTFDHNHITYNKDDCMRLYKTLPDWSVILLDESDAGVTRKDTMSKDNKEFASFMRQSRQVHKILIMCGPSIYDIDSYIAEHRVTFLLHCYFYKGLHPGYFRFYNKKDVQNLFYYEKKGRTYNRVPKFIGRFSKNETCDMELYTLKKKAAFDKFYDGKSTEQNVTREEAEHEYKRKRCLEYININNRSRITVKAFCDTLGISRPTFKKWHEQAGISTKGIKDYEIPEEEKEPTPEYLKENKKQTKNKEEENEIKEIIIPGIN